MKRKKIGITAEIVAMIVSCIVLFAIIVSFGSKTIFSKIIRGQIETLIENTCKIARDCVNGDYFEEYLESKGKSAASINSTRLLKKVCNDTKFNYLYIIRPDFENGKVINSLSVHGSMYDELELYEVGEITSITAEDYRLSYQKIMNGESDVEFVYRLNIPASSKTTPHVTGLVPIFSSSGKIKGIMCAEATFSWYRDAIRNYLTSFILLILIMLILVIIISSLLIRFRIIVPFLEIKKETERFAENNSIEEKTLVNKVNRNNELGQLAEAIDSMEYQTLQHLDNIAKMAAEKQNSEVQLKIATTIQSGALPKLIHPETVDLYAIMKPALEIGGDFYDFFMIDEKHLALVVADVSGKGVPAALFMMVSKIILRKNLKVGMTPSEALTKTNAELCEENPAEMFVTCLCGVLDLETNILTYANAGHEKPAFCKKGENFYLPNLKSGFVLGGMPGMKYKDETVQLAPGDMMFIYTDGIPEAMSPENEEFGNDRFMDVLNNSKQDSLSDICNKMFEKIQEFNDTVPQFDDITMLAFRIKE